MTQSQRQQSRLTQPQLQRREQQQHQQQQERVQFLLERITPIIESEIPEVRLDLYRMLLDFDDVAIQGGHLIARISDEQTTRVIFAEEPIQILDPSSDENISFEKQSSPELEPYHDPFAVIRIGQNYITQNEVEQRIIDSNAMQFPLERFNKQLSREDMQLHAQRINTLFYTLAPGGENRLTHGDIGDIQNCTRSVLSFYNFYIMFQSMIYSEEKLMGIPITHAHVYRKYLSALNVRQQLVTCMSTATAFTKLIHGRGLMVTVLHEKFRPNQIQNRVRIQQIINKFFADDEIARMALLVRRSANFNVFYTIIDENANDMIEDDNADNM